MTIRLSSAAVFIAMATIMGPDAPVGEATINTQQVEATRAVFNQEQHTKKLKNAEDVVDIVRNFSSGEKTAEFIQSELDATAGNEPALKWQSGVAHGRYVLTQILTHVQDLESGFELLHSYAFPDDNTKEDEFTHFTNRIYQADEQNIRASMVFSRYLESKKNSAPRFDDSSRAVYSFSLKQDSLRGNFGLRTPIGIHSFEPATAQSFDPLAQLSAMNGAFEEIGEYQYEMPVGSKIYNVTITPRHTDIETLTLEVEIREVDSIVTNTFVLVYELMN